MKNKAKRWMAGAIALIIFLGSTLFSNKKNNDEIIGVNYLKDIGKNNLLQYEIIKGENKEEKIQVISLNGIIQSDSNNEFVIEELKKAADNPDIKGVILKVNSPGGSVYASEKIAKEIKNLKDKKKPVYSVMEEMAASGGYYVSAPTDRIYASNETLTGSIGVIMKFYSLEGLFDKYGIKEQNIKSGKMKDSGTKGRNLNKEETDYYQGLVDSAFSHFVKIVSDGRNMSEDEVRKIADGRIYDGLQALENGLVDKIGDLDMAIDDMTKENNLNNPMVIESNRIENSLKALFQKVGDFKNNESDLAILKEFMEENTLSPMYLYGGSYGR